MDPTKVTGEKTTYGKGSLLMEKDDYNFESCEFPLEEQLMVVGRYSIKKNVDVPIPTQDNRLSRLHFVIRKYKEKNGEFRFSIAPRPNTNGTIVNGTKLQDEQEIFLSDGNVIIAGNTVLIFKGTD